MNHSKQLIKLFFVLALLAANYNFLLAQQYPEMVFVKGGTFKMGSISGDKDESPVHSVTLSDYYIAKYEVTVAQYKQFCMETGRRFPSSPKNEWYEEHPNAAKWVWKDNYPIVNVTWRDAMLYCRWLSKKTGENYTLPTEAQWEYAARGGKKSKRYKYSGSNDSKKVAWYDETTNEKGPKNVGQLSPNELGIFDMSGNAWEWCKDYFGKYPSTHQHNPTGAEKSPYRVVRGGSWYYVEYLSRLTARDGPEYFYTNFNYGFRVVKNI